MHDHYARSSVGIKAEGSGSGSCNKHNSPGASCLHTAKPLKLVLMGCSCSPQLCLHWGNSAASLAVPQTLMVFPQSTSCPPPTKMHPNLCSYLCILCICFFHAKVRVSPLQLPRSTCRTPRFLKFVKNSNFTKFSYSFYYFL